MSATTSRRIRPLRPALPLGKARVINHGAVQIAAPAASAPVSPAVSAEVVPALPKARTPWIVLLACAIAALINIPAAWAVGPVNASAAITLLVAVGFIACIPLLLRRPTRDRRLRGATVLGSAGTLHSARSVAATRRARVLPISLGLFLVYAGGRLMMDPAIEGIQNVAVFTMFILGIAFAAQGVTLERAARALQALRWTGVIVATLYFVTLAIGTQLYTARALALSALILLAPAIAMPASGLIMRLSPFLITGAIVSSLSRTASVIAVTLFAFFVVRLRRGNRLLLAIITLSIALVGVWLLVTTYEPLRERFLEGDNAADFGGLTINTSGRSVLWEMTLDSAAQSPIIGNGAGSASALISAHFTNISHPHNEYLRLYHDYGVIGLALFVWGFAALLGRVGRRAAHSDNPIHWAALIAMVAVALAATTDNVIIYPFVMLPLGALVGLSLGLPGEVAVSTPNPKKRVPARV
ncbi:hypothetical protein M2390_000838 [Mycetocola sp. BIGb0189]|uniref:O-antigen ligase family protein n=1 Tax=Mycetocola sp. BIGb0189 TaxID=2940604 RepID=UPI002169AD19|nr:O-antigen ligase family protein [Mycetocola sp. BIGb0189]MCS4275677.1 hypothetical protein [Mycetocola sp. BIGb0189]